MKRVTLRDIADELGVTVGTVSHALHDMKDISPATKQRVCEVAERMGYVSDGMASTLRSGRSRILAILMADIANPHIARQVRLIETTAGALGYASIILNTNEDAAQERIALRTATGKRVDGILICPAQDDTENLRYLQGLGIPYVLIGRESAQVPSDSVSCDDLAAGRMACEYLLSHACRRPLYIGPDRPSSAIARLAGIDDVLKGAGLPPVERLICQPTLGAGEAFTRLTAEGWHYDGMVVFSDLLAYEIRTVMRHIGMELPLVAFDAIQTHLPLPITHASVGMTGNGWMPQALDLLLSRLNHTAADPRPVQIRVPPQLYLFD